MARPRRRRRWQRGANVPLLIEDGACGGGCAPPQKFFRFLSSKEQVSVHSGCYFCSSIEWKLALFIKCGRFWRCGGWAGDGVKNAGVSREMHWNILKFFKIIFISFHYGTMSEIKKIRDGRLMAAARVWNSLKYFILTRNHVFTRATGEFDASLYFAVIRKHYIGLCNWCIFTLGLHQWRNSLHRITSFLQAYLKYFLC